MSKRRRMPNLSPRHRLELFLSCIDELSQRPFVLDGLFNFHFDISFDDPSGQLKCVFQEADQEYFRSFLLSFRKFIMNDEPVYVERVLNVCRQYVKDDGIKKELDELKTVWLYQYRKGVIQIQIKDRDLTPKYVLDLWINGQYFHGDPDKERELRELLSHELPSVKIQLLWSMPILTKTIIIIGDAVSKALKHEASEIS